MLGEEAFKTMQDGGMTMYFEQREGKFGRYVARAWLIRDPKKDHLYLLPDSAVFLEGPNDHARAIVKVYSGTIRENLVAGTFSKKFEGAPPSAALEYLASPLASHHGLCEDAEASPGASCSGLHENAEGAPGAPCSGLHKCKQASITLGIRTHDL